MQDNATLLVATDGTAAGDAAFTAASMIAAKWQSPVHVIVVVEPLPVLMEGVPPVIEPLVASPQLLDSVRDGVIAQMRQRVPASDEWHVDVEYGRPSSEISEKARHLGAQLIVIALVHHGVIDRILDGDTALDVVRQSAAPVLLASPEWTELPKRAVFAVDFSVASLMAARAGLRILRQGATVTLAHVRPVPIVFENMGMWEQDYETAAIKELSKFTDSLALPADIRVETELLRGRPSAVLLQLADRIDAQLIVAGTRGAGFVQRVLVGSVATGLMRHSTRSLLIVPEETA